MGITGTDVAKGASDMTLTDDNFATIVTAVKEGRSIYDNIRKSVQFLLSCNLGEVLTVFFGMLIFGASPLSAVQLLWLNLVTDSAPALALGTEPPEYDIMERKPRKKDESFFADGLGIAAAWQGAMMAIITLIAFWAGRTMHGAQSGYAETFAFVVLSLSQIVHSFNARSLKHSIIKTGIFSNKYIIGAFLLSLGLMLVATLTPLRNVLGVAALTGKDWIIISLLSVLPLIICEAVKLISHLIAKIRSNEQE
jgi:Ca2+-transporting ATPase